MEENNGRNKNWLFKQSSELELLISAAIVFASLKAGALVEDMIINLLNNNISGSNQWLFILAVVSLFTSRLLPISIIAHFLLRFYWLSLVGLRTIYESNADLSRFSERFAKSLKKPLNLDLQIQTIDRISSSIFAFSFMTLFAFCFSIASVMGIMFVLIPWLSDLGGPVWQEILTWVGNIFMFLCLIYMIDFFTLGWMKTIKKKWFTRIYYPIYRFMSIITLSFFYRGIYYSLVQHTSRKFIAILLPIYVFLTIFLLNAGYYPNKLFEGGVYSDLGSEYLRSTRYEDRFAEKVVLRGPFIESYVVPKGQDYLMLKIPLTGPLEDSILSRCEEVIPIIKNRTINWRNIITTGLTAPDLPDDFDLEKNTENIFNCLREHTRVVLNDSVLTDPVYHFAGHQKPSKIVFQHTMSISHLDRGEHDLVFRFYNEQDSVDVHIPFWKD